MSQQRDPSANVASSADTSSNAYLAQMMVDDEATPEASRVPRRAHAQEATISYKRRFSSIIIASKIATLQCKVWEDGKAALANAERVPVAETGANGH